MIPSLTIEYKKHSISVDWKELFTNFFGEKNMAKKVLSQTPADDSRAPSSPLCIHPVFENHLIGVRSSLQALGRSDIEVLQRYFNEEQAEGNQLHRLSRPVQWWNLNVGKTSAGNISRTSVDHCRVRWKADQLLNLNEEGCVIQTNLTSAQGNSRSAATARNNELQRKARTCDQCREKNIECAQQNGAISCNSCVMNDLQCHDELAELHRKLGCTRTQTYHIQLMIMMHATEDAIARS